MFSQIVKSNKSNRIASKSLMGHLEPNTHTHLSRSTDPKEGKKKQLMLSRCCFRLDYSKYNGGKQQQRLTCQAFLLLHDRHTMSSEVTISRTDLTKLPQISTSQCGNGSNWHSYITGPTLFPQFTFELLSQSHNQCICETLTTNIFTF